MMNMWIVSCRWPLQKGETVKLHQYCELLHHFVSVTGNNNMAASWRQIKPRGMAGNGVMGEWLKALTLTFGTGEVGRGGLAGWWIAFPFWSDQQSPSGASAELNAQRALILAILGSLRIIPFQLFQKPV